MNKFILIIFLSLSALSFGQYDMDDAKDTSDTKEPINTMELRERIYVGGDFSFSFGNQLYLMVAPMAGFDIYKGLSAGVSTMYQLRRFTFNNGSSVSYNAFGGGVFTRFRPPVLPMLLLQTQLDFYNTEDLQSPFVDARKTIPAWYGGIGYAGGFGKAYYQIMLMYDFVDDPSMPLPKFFGNIPLYIRYGMVFYLG